MHNNNETKKQMYREILLNKDLVKIWKKLDNGCYIGTMTYSEENALVLLDLLSSFEEQYGEEIDLSSAMEELKLYNDEGKLFIYFNEFMKPISMNGCIYNYSNSSFEFTGNNKINTLYFYGLSTLKEHRGKGACSALVEFAIEFAKYNGFDLVYARTDLIGSKSEKIMQKHGMEICKTKEETIIEWVDVTDDKGDYRKYLWLSFNDNIKIEPYNKIIPENNTDYSKVYKKQN